MCRLIFCTLLYIIVSAVITGMVRYPDIDARAPIAVAFADKAAETGSPLLRAATGLIAAGGLAGMTSVLLVLFLSQARVFMAMARDGLLPPVFGRVHPRWRTPHVATIVTGIVICLIAALTPIRKLAEMVNIGTLLAFVIVCAAVMIIRVRRPDAHRPFRCPALFVIAPLGIVVNLALMLFLPVDTWLRLVVWLAIGFVVYFSVQPAAQPSGPALAAGIDSAGTQRQRRAVERAGGLMEGWRDTDRIIMERLTMPLIEAQGLKKTYHTGEVDVEVLRGIDLEIARGEFVAIMGPSGSGKSTLLHLLGGIDVPTSGRVVLDGEDLSTLGDDGRTLLRRRRLGFIFQTFNLLPTLTAEENVALPLELDGVPSPEALRACRSGIGAGGHVPPPPARARQIVGRRAAARGGGPRAGDQTLGVAG